MQGAFRLRLGRHHGRYLLVGELDSRVSLLHSLSFSMLHILEYHNSLHGLAISAHILTVTTILVTYYIYTKGTVREEDFPTLKAIMKTGFPYPKLEMSGQVHSICTE